MFKEKGKQNMWGLEGSRNKKQSVLEDRETQYCGKTHAISRVCAFSRHNSSKK